MHLVITPYQHALSAIHSTSSHPSSFTHTPLHPPLTPLPPLSLAHVEAMRTIRAWLRLLVFYHSPPFSHPPLTPLPPFTPPLSSPCGSYAHHTRLATTTSLLPLPPPQPSNPPFTPFTPPLTLYL